MLLSHYNRLNPGRVAQSVARVTEVPEVPGSVTDHEIFSTVTPPPFDSMATVYCLTVQEVEASSGIVWLG